MAATGNKEALTRFDRARDNGVFATLFEIAIALLIGFVLATILGVMTY